MTRKMLTSCSVIRYSIREGEKGNRSEWWTRDRRLWVERGNAEIASNGVPSCKRWGGGGGRGQRGILEDRESQTEPERAKREQLSEEKKGADKTVWGRQLCLFLQGTRGFSACEVKQENRRTRAERAERAEKAGWGH